MYGMSKLLAVVASLAPLRVSAAAPPRVKTLNGTYQGRYLPEWDQDAFLGIPYAEPPLGNLRFRWPQPLNSSFKGVRDATEQGYSCMQWGSDFNISEDCLNLDVVRPSGHQKESLPVLVWIYGGGLASGSIADPMYNLSGIVKTSQDMGSPIIAVEMNYRLNMYGFLQTPQLLAEGSSNAGLLDQRMALQWIQENIRAFGGDPDRVVIWGESAGAQSIGYHLFSFGGRNDHLYRGAIMESGGPTGTSVQDITYYASPVENLTRTVGCWDASDQLACLRGVSQETLFNAYPSQTWNPLIDGVFLEGYPSQLMKVNKFNHVSLLIGTNTDEGTSFSLPDINTNEDLFLGLMDWRSYALSAPTIRRLMELYPNDPCYEPPYEITNCTIFPSEGLQWRRGAAIGGDMVMMSGRRRMCELYTGAGQDIYSFRFDTRLFNTSAVMGVSHGVNVPFSFQNITGALGPKPEYDSAGKLSKAIGEAYVRYVHGLDPNPTAGKQYGSKPWQFLPEWPKYDLEKPANMVLNATRPFVEPDTWRKAGIDFLKTYDVSRELLA